MRLSDPDDDIGPEAERDEGREAGDALPVPRPRSEPTAAAPSVVGLKFLP